MELQLSSSMNKHRSLLYQNDTAKSVKSQLALLQEKHKSSINTFQSLEPVYDYKSNIPYHVKRNVITKSDTTFGGTTVFKIEKTPPIIAESLMLRLKITGNGNGSDDTMHKHG